ncbi:MAG TPA: GNAT family N-acetyltransferase [Anaerolineae bacterium]|nr:GNAT family N-acetyltransferase [Anaerolineae bacterium]
MLAYSQQKLNTVPDPYLSRPAHIDDLDDVVNLYNVCAQVQQNGHATTPEEVRADWTAEGFNMETSTRIVTTPDGQIIASVQIWDIDKPTVKMWCWGDVHPDYEHQGIGTYLLHWALNRAHEVAQTVDPDLKVTLQMGAINTYEPINHLFATHPDSRLIRHFFTMAIEMTTPPPAPATIMGINGSPLTIRHLANNSATRRRFYDAHLDAFQDHWGFVMPTDPDQDFKTWEHWFLSDKKFDHTLWFAAMDGDEIAGISLCKWETADDPAMGWVNILGVRRPWRRSGLGLALLHHSFNTFYQRGRRKVGLGVDASSLTGATRLYEKAGMKPIRQYNSYEWVIRPGRDISRQQIDES